MNVPTYVLFIVSPFNLILNYLLVSDQLSAPLICTPSSRANTKLIVSLRYTSGNAPSCRFNNATTITIYEAPTPLSTQQHRYTFLAYREPKGYEPDVVTAQLRPGFDVVQYAKDNKLVLVGGNFFREALTNT